MQSVAIGIDLGTTYSCVSVFQDGKARIIPNELGQPTTPSWVAFDGDGTDIVAGDLAKRPTRDPETSVFDAKRLIGRAFSDPIVQQDMKVWPFKVVRSSDDDDTPKIQVHGKTYFAEQISAMILQKMKEIAESHLGVKVVDAVVTVPAYFNNGQRQATKDAGEIAGLNVLKIINEPTAAAIAYNLHRASESKMKNVLIFDLGGGTLDVAVLSIFEGEIIVKAVGGDTHLGGQDFDNELLLHCIRIFNEKYKTDLGKVSNPATAKAFKRIRHECEKQKCILSSASKSTTKTAISLDVVYAGQDMDISISREEFENLEQNKKLFQKCITVVQGVIQDAVLTREEIDDVVLVGGSTRIPKIQEMLSAFFGGKSLVRTMNPEEAVASGAAVLAAALQVSSNEKKKPDLLFGTKIKDVTPFSLGLRDYTGNRMSVLIPKNTSIPCTQKRCRLTTEDWQTKIVFHIYEGEDPIATNNHLLGKFVLNDIPSAKAGVEEVEATMTINEDGILHVKAVVKSNQSFGSIAITSLQGRLSKELIKDLKKMQANTTVKT